MTLLRSAVERTLGFFKGFAGSFRRGSEATIRRGHGRLAVVFHSRRLGRHGAAARIMREASRMFWRPITLCTVHSLCGSVGFSRTRRTICGK